MCQKAAVLLSISRSIKRRKPACRFFYDRQARTRTLKKLSGNGEAKAEKSKPPQPGIRILHQRCQDRRNLACAGYACHVQAAKRQGRRFIPLYGNFRARAASFHQPLPPNCAGGCHPLSGQKGRRFFGKAIYRLLQGGGQALCQQCALAGCIFHISKVEGSGSCCRTILQYCQCPAQSWSLKAGLCGGLRKSRTGQRRICWACGQSPLPARPGYIPVFWPVGLSRFGLSGIEMPAKCSSPRGEIFWNRRYGQNDRIYPGWPLDLQSKRKGIAERRLQLLLSWMKTAAGIAATRKKRPV